jgi:hypothetical protein
LVHKQRQLLVTANSSDFSLLSHILSSCGWRVNLTDMPHGLQNTWVLYEIKQADVILFVKFVNKSVLTSYFLIYIGKGLWKQSAWDLRV